MNIVKDKFGRPVPASIARIAAGRDAYLRKASVKCVDCGGTYCLDGAESSECCNGCWDIAGIENEVADGLISEAEGAEQIAAIRAQQKTGVQS